MRIYAIRSIFCIFAFSLAFFAFEKISKIGFIGVDFQEETCLDERVYLARNESSPKISIGDVVFFINPAPFGRMKPGIVFAKKITASEGDAVQIKEGKAYINGNLLGPMHHCSLKLKGNDMCKDRSYVIQPGDIFMTGTSEKSYDSRYWGPINIDKVKGHVFPIL